MSEAVDLVVFSERGPSGPRVMEVLAVEDLTGSGDGVAFTTTPVFARLGYDRPLEWSGNVPVRLGDRLTSRGHDAIGLLRAQGHDPDRTERGPR